jgi:RNA polymerase sigma-70 factor (ECF subfamily)
VEDALLVRRATSPDADDAELARAAADDRAAFAAIYELHRTPVYRYLRARTATDADAQDLTAATFERAMEAIARFRPTGGGLVAWLIRIARNAHADSVRVQRRRGGHDANRPDAAAMDAPDDLVVLRALVNALPPGQQDAIQLRFAAGLTAREIGVVLGITEAAAQKQVERGLQALREAFHDD